MSGDEFGRKKLDEGELDMTPMIDVTFLLLIFFMIASTMKPGGEEQLAPAKNGKGVTPESMIQLSVLAPLSDGEKPILKIDGNQVTLEEVTSLVRERAESAGNQVLIRADRDVPNGYLAEVYGACREVEGIEFHQAVEEKK
ncbi:MAG: ExbD/TolR family protein [Planctomycetaceae bacterium]